MPSTSGPTGVRRKPKQSTIRWLIVAINIVEALATLAFLIWAYGLAEHLVAAEETAEPHQVASRTVGWWFVTFDVTLNMSLLIVGAAAGAAGSVIRQTMDYARTSRTREHRSVAWYLLRPLWSALLGSVSVIAVNTGLISIGDETTSSAGVAVLVLTGCLAGLFTDQVLARLRRMLDTTPRRPRSTN